MANEKRLVNAEAIARKLKNAFCAECNVVRKVQCSACWVEDVLELLEGDTVDAIVTPVKIGQILWCIIPHSEHPLECRVYCICREERDGLILDYFRCAVKGWFAKAFGFEDVGKTVFFTKEEALAKMDGERKDNG